MNVHIHINTDNDAFVDRTDAELADILDTLSRKICVTGIHNLDGLPLRDSNGNTVGRIIIEPNETESDEH